MNRSGSLTAGAGRLAVLRRLGMDRRLAAPVFDRLAAAAARCMAAASARLVLGDCWGGAVLGTAGPEGVAGSTLEVPLVGADGERVGTFAVHDGRPREWSEGEAAIVGELARAAMDALELSLEKLLLETVGDSAQDGVLVLARDGTVLSYNPRFAELWQIPAEVLATGSGPALLGSAMSSIEDHESFRRRAEEVYAVDAPVRDEVEMSDGRVLSRYSVPLRAGDGAQLGRIWQFRDISVRKRAERAVEEGRQRLHAFVESASDAAFTVDESGVITYANPATERIFGYRPAEVLGRSLRMLVSKRVGDRQLAGIEREISAGARRIPWGAIELYGRHRDGREIPIEISFGRFTAGGREYFTGLVRDIAERKQVERVMHDAAVSYRTLFDSLEELVCIIDMDGALLSVNEAVVQRHGYAREDILGGPPSQLTASEHGDPEGALARMRGDPPPEPLRLEWWGRTKAGERFPMEVVLTRGEYFGAPVVIAVGRDTTERRRAEQALRWMGTLVECSADAIISTSLDGATTSWNPAAERIFGYTAEEMIGKSWAVAVPHEALPGYRAVLDEIAEGRTPAPYEAQRVRRDGERIDVAVTPFPVHDESGRVVGAASIVRDVTESKAREEQRRLLAAALERLDEGVTLTTFDGEIIYANENHGRILGYDPDLQPRPPYTAFLPDEAAEEEHQRILDAVVAEGGWTGRVRRRRVDDGQIVPVELIMGRIDRPGEAQTLLFSIVRDVSAEIEQERYLRRAERLASVGTLVGGVAHELNNPLHAVRSFAELMLMEERNQEDREALEIMKREADRAAKIVADLRLFARQTQEERSARSAVDLNDVVRHVIKVRRYSLDTRNVAVVEELAADLPPVLANRGELEQVVMNLVVNAEQAMIRSDRGRRLKLKTGTARGVVVLRVSDTGDGIAPEHRERIFDPFFTTKSPGEGTGLGLSVVHSIVSDHGGRIRVQSDARKGTTFLVELPVAGPADRVAVDDAGHSQAPRGDLRVLVVEDEGAVRRATVRYLTRVGYRAEGAADGREALEMLDQGEYDAIVSDLRMPGLDGEALLRELRQRGGGLERRLIFITGDASGARGAPFLAAGSVPVLLKPVRLEEVARLVARLVGAGSSASATGA